MIDNCLLSGSSAGSTMALSNHKSLEAFLCYANGAVQKDNVQTKAALHVQEVLQRQEVIGPVGDVRLDLNIPEPPNLQVSKTPAGKRRRKGSISQLVITDH